jgi:hypothetical protein
VREDANRYKYIDARWAIFVPSSTEACMCHNLDFVLNKKPAAGLARIIYQGYRRKNMSLFTGQGGSNGYREWNLPCEILA